MDDHPAEEVEHIPWSQLLEEHRAARPWPVYLAAGLVAAAALGVIGVRALRNPVAPAVTTEASTTLAVAGEVIEPIEPPASTAPLSEADLMAVYPPGDERAAAARAEWFVTDYFTRDGGEEGAPTAVEWARALDVSGSGPGRFRVTVVFRNVTATETGWERGPARAVAVTVAGSAIVDLPEPTDLDVPEIEAGVTGDEQAVAPEAVATAALAIARTWGADPVLVGADPVEQGVWRVVVEASDETGHRWRLAVHLDGDGAPAG